MSSNRPTPVLASAGTPVVAAGSRLARWLYVPMLAMCLLVVAYVLFGYGTQPLGSMVTPQLKEVFEQHPFGIYLHVFAACFALALGPFQFLARLRRRAPRLHRWMGRLYLSVGVGLGGFAGLYMAAQSAGGLGARLGFGTLAVAWLYTGWRAYQAIRRGDVIEHQRWMLRNFALTFAGVTLRLLLWSAIAWSPHRFYDYYPFISWLCWVPNALVAEAWLRRGTRWARPAETLRTAH